MRQATSQQHTSEMHGQRRLTLLIMSTVRNGFPTRLKSKEVDVEQEITGKETVNAKLSSRAVVKEQGLGDVCLHKRRATQVETQLERWLNLEQDADSHCRMCRSGFEGNRGRTSVSTLETT